MEHIPTELDKWTILLTNLTGEQLKAEKAWDLYAIRWQIELFFKLLKGEMNLTKFTHANVDRIKAEIYLKYIVLALLMLVTATITEKEISLMKAIAVIKNFCAEIFSSTYKKIYITISRMQFCILNFCKKERRNKRPTSKEKLGLEVRSCA